MQFRTLRFTPIATLAIAVALAAAIWLVTPVLSGRQLRLWEVLVVLAAVFAMLEFWRARRLRREREQTENMRDSALW